MKHWLSFFIVALFMICLMSEVNLFAQTAPVVDSTSSVVTSITRTSAVCGGYIGNSGNSILMDRGICYNTTGNPTILSGTVVASYKVSNAVKYEPSYLVGLLPNTKYYIRAYATNKVGTGYGNQITFTTSSGNAEVTWPLLTDLTASNVGNINGSDLDTNHCHYQSVYNQGVAGNFLYDGDGWLKIPTKSSQMAAAYDANFYIQFTVLPKSGNNLTIKSISFGMLGYKTTSLKMAAYYSLNAFITNGSALGTATVGDSVHSTFAATTENPISLLTGNPAITTPMGREYVNFSPNIVVKDGQTLTVRLYVWGKSAATMGIKGLAVTGSSTTASSIDKTSLPESFSLSQNYPNPFNPATKIEFSIPKVTNVRLEVFDILGKKVSTLLDEKKSAGKYSVDFNASNLSSGIYFYRLHTSEKIITNKMLLMK